ncbi:hydrogenase expression/formation protein HypE [Flexistipes sinusarabici DSM 4947]|uniref:Hydrogenase expression/formation protein HypE n=1 Tax=Flexistipes sinusarabici (strain ATCC 49648 / DSM 4947 / MAS 10) TaxID=717231 RepID=F8E9E2_FLESM|nr:hydrogenase expression/formation protein HypE [Flexistipes sinusarabici]AEI14194.1 hydrogenase expression/formation protein HypE [Flexistipes sinusarabici DSM 4947]
MEDKKITSALGSGGKSTNDFVKDIICKYFGNSILENLGDAAYLDINGELSFSTDSFVVEPEFFPGGDIGKLAVYGTCNDLSVSGAKPKFLSFSLIVPEGYKFSDTEKIVASAGAAAEEAGVQIVCGDTKVISASGLKSPLVNTAGLGILKKKLNDYGKIKAGDKIILTSDIARHGMCIVSKREGLNIESEIESDCADLNPIFEVSGYKGVKFARDATRGGVAAVLNEISDKTGLGFLIDEAEIPMREDVKYLCEFLGFDPLSVANEGAALLIVESALSSKILDKIKSVKVGADAALIGEVCSENKVMLKTPIGGIRNVEMPVGELLPRIC